MSGFTNSQGAASTQVGTANASVGLEQINSDLGSIGSIPVPGLGTPPQTGMVGVRRAGDGMAWQPPEGDISAGEPPSMSAALLKLLNQGTKNPTAVKTIQERLIKAGYLNPSDSTMSLGTVSYGDATYSAYARALEEAVITTKPLPSILAAGEKGTTGEAYWKAYKKQFNAAGQAQPTTRTTTDTSVNLTSAPDAQATAASEYEDLIGRAPTQAESAAYYAGLNAAEQANPSTNTTTTTYGAGGNARTESSVNSGGIGAGGADQIAQADIIQNHGKQYAQSQGDQIYNLFSSLISGGS